MEHAFKVGLSFGLTSGVITTLGLMVGLNSSTHSRLVVLGGILTIAIADAFSDAFGIHISQEFSENHTEKTLWKSTISTFFFKFIFALTFIIPVLIFSLTTAIWISIIWGLILISFFSFIIAKNQNKNPKKIILQHIIITIGIIIITHFVGDFISSVFV
ncbi:MAG: hypothetical protein ABIG37_00495 [Nanoarchaeota archaeon]|nr:hypothetical protein [Nanoarchaeota archaeon]